MDSAQEVSTMASPKDLASLKVPHRNKAEGDELFKNIVLIKVILPTAGETAQQWKALADLKEDLHCS